ncbi:hypothetical protein [Polluticoccus soli]|uniref:hypothetical protein n=1 Tax=Polluticoccus soli TaxID=3034150 RepID=UPI0023E274C1|nr:hypothetical protein [Flavipsychrobacter sp. JY13-12]
MNIRRQDGFKMPLLCTDCERLFGNFETYFAASIFYPVIDKDDNFSYDERLLKFVVSVMWRLMHHSLIDDHSGLPFYNEVLRAEKIWSEYLLDDKPPTEFNHLHMWIGVDIEQPDGSIQVEMPSRLVQYLARMVDSGITDNGDDFCMFYLKLPRFIFIIPLTTYDESKWLNTRISPAGGLFAIKEAGIADTAVGQFILGRPLKLEKAMNQMSSVQRQKMRQAGVDNRERLKENDLGDILTYQENKQANN